MTPSNALNRRDRLSDDELAAFESQLRTEGYRLTQKTSEIELLPGEYLKRQRPSYVYAYASPIVWELVWSDLRRSAARPASKAAPRETRRRT